jgi:hypothetical protein
MDIISFQSSFWRDYFMFKARNIYRWVIMTIIVFVMSFFVLYNRSENGQQIPKEPISQPPMTVEEVTAPKVRPDTPIICETYYSKCGHMITERITPKPNDLELDRVSFAANYEGWTVVDFSESFIRLKKVIDDFCPDKYYIGVDKGVIALFHGEPGKGDQIVMERTTISIEFLRDSDKKLLEKGIPIKDVQEFFKIREGFSN